MSDRAVGGCLCGSVRFAAELPSLFCCHCHCAWCRRAHGAAFVTWLGVRESGFSLTAGEDALVWYRSSELSERGFCSRCGTTLFFRSTAAPGEVHIALACVDGEIDRAPSVHVFYDAHVPWVTLGDDLKRVESDHGALAKYKAVPRAPS